MKKKLIIVAVIIAYIILCVFFVRTLNVSYTNETRIELSKMSTPVILYYKDRTSTRYSVVLEDGDGILHRWGNMSSVADSLGINYSIGDTIRK